MSYKQKHHKNLRIFLDFIQICGILNTERKKSMKKTNPITLPQNQVDALLSQPNIKCSTGLRNRTLLHLMRYAGLRVSEICKMQRKDIRWDTGTVEVRGGKGGKDRTVPIDNTTLAWLQMWDEKRPKTNGRTAFFFCTLKGGKLSSRYIEAMIKRIALNAKIERAHLVTPHVLRHTYATEMLRDGYNISEVQTLLGHERIGTTERYLHVDEKALADKIQGRNEQSKTSRLAELLGIPIDTANQVIMALGTI